MPTFWQKTVQANTASHHTTHPDVVDLLVSAGADVDAINNHGDALLFHAIRRGRAQVAQRLLDFGADPNGPRDCPSVVVGEASDSDLLFQVLISHTIDIPASPRLASKPG